ncbi:MAG: hypothetical protein FWC16_06935 [Defluviitaleaceae bacterium]|nr:hypothetical protein [Defluviitaleaceae bacterium]MCL2274646.1 hypothetical protein [Defluviitaleaceae bacterium]
MVQYIKRGHVQLFLLFIVLMVLSSLLLVTGNIFTPLHDGIILFVLLAPIIAFTVIAVQKSNDKASFLPAILPPLAGGIMPLLLLAVSMSFITRFWLFLVMAACSMIVFFVCVRRLQQRWMNKVISVVYLLAVFICGIIIFYGTLFISVSSVRVEHEAILSPNGRYAAEVGTAVSVIDTLPVVTIRRSNNVNLGIGRIMPRGQMIWGGVPIRGSSSADIQSLEWISDDVFIVTYYGTRGQWIIRRDEDTWRTEHRSR